jgi:hypothetical protein
MNHLVSRKGDRCASILEMNTNLLAKKREMKFEQ